MQEFQLIFDHIKLVIIPKDARISQDIQWKNRHPIE